MKITPEDFHVVAQHFVDAQNALDRIRADMLTALDAANGAAGACDGAHQYEDGWAAAMDSILNDGFHTAFDLLGSIGQGIDVSAVNHVTADHDSAPGQPGGPAPWTPLTPNPWPANTDFAVLTGPSPWWMPAFLEKYIPTADTGRLDDAATACRAAAEAIRELAANLHTELQELLGNNTSADLDELDQFWQRAAGSQSILTGLPQALDDVTNSLIDFRVWNDDTQEAIKNKIKAVIESFGAVAVVIGIGSVLTDGGLDAIIVAVIKALDFVGVDASGALVAPIAEVAATAVTGLVAAGGAVAITQGVGPAIRAAMSSTPNPNVEGIDATKISDELATGKIDESASEFDPAERTVADRLAKEGHDVTALKPSTEPRVRTPDALVDGTPTEFKTITTQTPSSTKIMRVLDESARNGGQAREIVINAENTPLTREEALQGIQRFKGLGKNAYDKIVIWGNGWTVTGP
ncbi:MAG TPA: hypothetical protein VJT49_22185 [Amycolatopsis sp.]|uniref:CdiA C-terminal domain-containing protein n=1 Tax=Amycolatopsis sp. TaxID=37632 RepID=UPI002B46B322|nr:hypothetical protein [Amycolatopsis sp.]HKS47770.1 hypothetical protein [Amycolatopsis sp.]